MKRVARPFTVGARKIPANGRSPFFGDLAFISDLASGMCHMIQRRDFLQATLVAGAACLSPFGSTALLAEDKKKIKMLMLTQSGSFRHDPVARPDGQKSQLSAAEIAVTQLGQQSGLFEVHCTQDAAADFTKENLQKYDLVFFYTQGEQLKIKEEDLDYFFKEWLPAKGHGFIGTHSATDTFCNYKPYWDMIGGSFDGHPWGSGTTVTIKVHEPKHPAVSMWGDEFQIKDEIYQYKNWQPEKVRVLMSLDMSKCQPKGDRHVPVSWVKQYGEGKVFYTNLGHNRETWTNKTFVKHLEGGIRWVLGLEQGDATPNPELSKVENEKAKAEKAK
jgi:type 1 glutamine amidotransferase